MRCLHLEVGIERHILIHEAQLGQIIFTLSTNLILLGIIRIFIFLTLRILCESHSVETALILLLIEE